MQTEKPARSLTVADVAPGQIATSLPEFCEVPDAPRLWGLRKTMIYRGIHEGWFKSVLVRMPGNKSGKRLLHCQSVRDWLTRQMEAQQGEAAAK